MQNGTMQRPAEANNGSTPGRTRRVAWRLTIRTQYIAVVLARARRTSARNHPRVMASMAKRTWPGTFGSGQRTGTRIQDRPLAITARIRPGPALGRSAVGISPMLRWTCSRQVGAWATHGVVTGGPVRSGPGARGPRSISGRLGALTSSIRARRSEDRRRGSP